MITAQQMDSTLAQREDRKADVIMPVTAATDEPPMLDLPEPTVPGVVISAPKPSVVTSAPRIPEPVAAALPKATLPDKVVVVVEPKSMPQVLAEPKKIATPLLIEPRANTTVVINTPAPRIKRDSIITLTTIKRPDGRATPVSKISYRTDEAPATRPRGTSAEEIVRESSWISPGPNPPRVNLSFYRDELADVLTLFAKTGNVSILTSDEADVTGKMVTAELSDQPWNLALESLLRAVGLRAVQDAATGIITVQSERRSSSLRQPEIIRLRYVDADDILPILQAIISSDASSSRGGGSAIGAGIAAGGGGTAPQQGGGATSVSVNQEGDVITAVKTGQAKSRTLMVYSSPDKIAKVREMVAKVDRKRPTVAIQVRMVFINRSKINRYGFNYSIVPKTASASNASAIISPSNGLGEVSAGSSGSAFSMLTSLALNRRTDLTVFFDALSSVGLAEVEAAPLITTTSDLQASINVGEFFILPNPSNIVSGTNVVVPGGAGGNLGGGGQQGQQPQQSGGVGSVGGQSTFSTFQTGTVLEVTPYALPNGRIRMAIKWQRDQGNLDSNKGTITGPRQTAQTEVIVDDNEIIVIGGLTVVQKTIQKGGVPVLNELPIIGPLFKSQNTENQLFQDLVIVVQPKIIDSDDEDSDIINYQPAMPALPSGKKQ